jgi:hypothetical protein
MNVLLLLIFLITFDFVLFIISLRSAVIYVRSNHFLFQWISFLLLFFLHFVTIEVIYDFTSLLFSTQFAIEIIHILFAALALLFSYLQYNNLLLYVRKHIATSENSSEE